MAKITKTKMPNVHIWCHALFTTIIPSALVYSLFTAYGLVSGGASLYLISAFMTTDTAVYDRFKYTHGEYRNIAGFIYNFLEFTVKYALTLFLLSSLAPAMAPLATSALANPNTFFMLNNLKTIVSANFANVLLRVSLIKMFNRAFDFIANKFLAPVNSKTWQGILITEKTFVQSNFTIFKNYIINNYPVRNKIRTAVVYAGVLSLGVKLSAVVGLTYGGFALLGSIAYIASLVTNNVSFARSASVINQLQLSITGLNAILREHEMSEKCPSCVFKRKVAQREIESNPALTAWFVANIDKGDDSFNNGADANTLGARMLDGAAEKHNRNIIS